MPRVLTACCVFLFAGAAGWAVAAESSAVAADDPGPAIELPPVNVTADRPLPLPESWRYARLPGLEILSDVPDRQAQKIVRDLQMFNAAIDVVWPGVKGHRPVPLTLILGGSAKNFASFLPDAAGGSAYSKASVLLRDSEQAVIALNMGNKVLQIRSSDADAAPLDPRTAYGLSGGPALGTTDDDLQRLVDYHQQLQREYVRYLLSSSPTRLPAWFEEGLARLLMKMRVDPKFIEFGKVEDPNLAPAGTVDGASVGSEAGLVRPTEERDFNATLATKGLIPFDEFFAVTRDSPEASALGGKWSRQAEALVHLWLYGEGGRFNAGFAKFLERATREPVTEAMFKECFKMSYYEMLSALRIYVTNTAYTYKQFNAGKGGGLPEPAPLVWREATESESARLKGETQILAGHVEQAREEMLRPYIRGERDPALLASLGLVEKQLGETERARKFLEVAVQKQVVRPRAYVALAELRLAEAQPAADGSVLTAGQTQTVLQPLLAARTQRPPIPELYELMAEVWLRSATAPTKEDLALLNQAVGFFQFRPVLLLRVAELNGRNGDPARARSLAELGVKLARTPEAKRAFEEVIAGLPAPAAVR